MLGVALLLMAGAALISANPVDIQAQDPSTVLSSVEELVQSLKEVVEGDQAVQQELLRAVQSMAATQVDLQQLIAGSNEIDLDARPSTHLPALPVPQTRRSGTSGTSSRLVQPIKPLLDLSAGKVNTGGSALPMPLNMIFDQAAPLNVSIHTGSAAYLHCIVHNLSHNTVSWVRQRDLHLLTVGWFTYTSDERFEMIHSLGSQDWILKISDAQVRDSGSYVCQVSSDPVRVYQVYLNVFEAVIESNIAFFTRHVETALNSGNNTQLEQVNKELKGLNTALGGYFKELTCPDPFIPIGDECFKFLLEDLSWEDSKQRCGTLGAALAEPKNITQVRLYINVNFPRESRRNFWIGGVNNNKVWEWLSGTPLPNDYWYTNEPSGNGECLAMFDGWDRPLTDFPCESPRRAVCEKRTTWEPITEQKNQL